MSKTLSEMCSDHFDEYKALLDEGEWQAVRDKLKEDSLMDLSRGVIEVANLQKTALVITKNVACLRIARDELKAAHDLVIKKYGF